MSGSIGIGTETLRNTKQILENAQNNLARQNDPDATRVDASSVVTTVSGAFRTSVAYSSPVDNLSFKTRIDHISGLSKSETFSEAYEQYQTMLKGTDSTEARLSRTLSEFIGAANTFKADRNISVRQSFIDKAERLSSTVNLTVGGIKSIRDSVHNDLNASLADANSAIRQLFFVNQQISKASVSNGSTFRLYNDRDRAINKLAEKFSLDVSFGAKGQALVSLAGSKIELVSIGNYSEFSTSGNFVQDPPIESSPEDLMISLTRKNADNTVLSKENLVGGGIDEPKLIGGQIEALVQLRDVTLKEALDSVRLVRQTIADEVNSLHNDSSSWPPVSELISEKMVYGDDTLGFSGTLSLFALDGAGNQLLGDGGRLHRTTIDFDSLRTNHPSKLPTIHDIISEINVQLDQNVSRSRYALGQIGVNAAISTKEFLLNNVQIAATKDITDGEFAFDLDLFGNSYFGSKVQVVSVSGPKGLVDPANLPGDFRLEKDTSTRTNEEIRVPVNAAPGQDIRVQIRVIGDNGVVDEGVLRFNIDGSDAAVLNKRFVASGVIPNPPIRAPGFQYKAASHAGVARAKLVDINGVEILSSDNNTQGRLVIESNNESQFRFALQGSDFSKKLGLNNFFTISGDTMDVRSDIVDDPNKISAGRVEKTESARVAVYNGGNKAKRSLAFTTGGVDLAGGSVTIAGKPYNITPKGSLAVTLTNLANAINSDANTSSKVFASVTGGDTLEIEAISGGSWGNNLAIAATAAGGDSISLDGTGSVNNIATTNFVGGTDVSSNMQMAEYNLGSKSSEFFDHLFELKDRIIEFKGGGLIPDSISTLGGFVSTFVTVMNNQYNDAKAESDTRLSVFDSFDKQFRIDFGIDPEKMYFEMFNIMSVYKMQSELFAQIFKTIKEVQEIISVA